MTNFYGSQVSDRCPSGYLFCNAKASFLMTQLIHFSVADPDDHCISNAEVEIKFIFDDIL